MADASRGPRPRPTSPSVWIWRWHVTMVASIAHRASGAALYAGALILMLLALSLASGRDGYEAFRALLGSIPGKVVLFGLTVSAFYHMANGVRHLTWDAGAGFEPKTADLTAWLAFGFALVMSVGIWVLAAMTGAL
jgi:succinate dehydrogenase / fumarate reductase cytochrome b subunit